LHEIAYPSLRGKEVFMYRIEKTDYGFRLEFEGFIQADEMRAWFEECKKLLEDAPKGFHVMANMRKMKTLPPDAKKILEEGQRYFASKGGIRSAVIASDVITKEQQRNIGVRSGVAEFEQYIDGSQPDWEQKALDWLKNRIPPE
jgi:hypothetical protein